MLTWAVSSVPISGIIWDSLPILPDMAKAKLVIQVRSGAINQQSSIHNYHDENHFQERYISSDIVSILIQDLSSFKDDSSVAFSMARSVMLNNVEIYL